MAGIPNDGIYISYGHESIPYHGAIASGGIVKFQKLSQVFPNCTRRFNILYMLSSNYPVDAYRLCDLAKQKGAKIVWNQDGVCYPAWMPSGWEEMNKYMAGLLHNADYVFYQSKFSKFSSDHFLGQRKGPFEILYNAVDTDLFCPSRHKRGTILDAPLLLTAGSKYFIDRIETPIRILHLVRKKYPKSRIIFAGPVQEHLRGPMNTLISELGLEDAVILLPPYTQNDAPEIFKKADIFIHPKINDPCPGVVIEAMACGLPIVYSISGGTPELVGKEAGVGIPTEVNWERFKQPIHEDWAEAVLAIAKDLDSYKEAARQRAIDNFDLRQWVERHRLIFSKLLCKR